MKDHANFLRAARIVRQRYPDVHYIMAGERMDRTNQELARMVEEFGLLGRVHLPGVRNDVQMVAAALDIAASSSSSGEGFSNVIGEAMSCGVPCIVTDVRDLPTSWRIPERSYPAATHKQAISQMMESGKAHRGQLGARARQRVIDNFALEAVVRRYENLYTQVNDEYSSKRRT